MPTKIEWTDETWNPITGCTPISTGCAHCFAKRMSRRLAGRHGYPEAPHHFDVTFHPDRLEQPLHWKKPRKIFVCSMSDLFHPLVKLEWQLAVLDIIKRCPQHTFQILTKRPIQTAMLYECTGWEPPGNVWLGVTAENQKQADKRIPILLRIPAAKRFVSIEPCLGPIDIERFTVCPFCNMPDAWHSSQLECKCGHLLDWVIVGAETGPGKRTMDLDWARSIRDQCQVAGAAYFFKKDSDGNHELDGRVWEEFPNATG